ncbi:rCG61461 [Rattus norvegicus]|uniref:RCG61461 n=1 Tax=Rattus norvegicus TaxID=10116 RepID=A6HBT7_RAT|nr:rCG61461 [Rattus norvegicus]
MDFAMMIWLNLPVI